MVNRVNIRGDGVSLTEIRVDGSENRRLGHLPLRTVRGILRSKFLVPQHIYSTVSPVVLNSCFSSAPSL